MERGGPFGPLWETGMVDVLTHEMLSNAAQTGGKKEAAKPSIIEVAAQALDGLKKYGLLEGEGRKMHGMLVQTGNLDASAGKAFFEQKLNEKFDSPGAE